MKFFEITGVDSNGEEFLTTVSLDSVKTITDLKSTSLNIPANTAIVLKDEDSPLYIKEEYELILDLLAGCGCDVMIKTERRKSIEEKLSTMLPQHKKLQ